MVIELLVGTMRLDRGGIVAVEDDMRQTYTVTYTEGSDPFELARDLCLVGPRRNCRGGE